VVVRIPNLNTKKINWLENESCRVRVVTKSKSFFSRTRADESGNKLVVPRQVPTRRITAHVVLGGFTCPLCASIRTSALKVPEVEITLLNSPKNRGKTRASATQNK